MAYSVLYLHPDNPCNTTIVDETDEKIYVVTTDFTDMDKPTTRVKRANGEQVAEWVWRSGFRSDLLTFGNATPASASSWMKKSKIPFVEWAWKHYGVSASHRDPSSITFQDHVQGREFKWGNTSPGLQPQVLSFLI